MKSTMVDWLEKRKGYWWWVPEVSELSDRAVLEGVMNYGKWVDFLDLKERWGLGKIDRLYKEMVEGPRCNLRLPVKALYKEYLKRHA